MAEVKEQPEIYHKWEVVSIVYNNGVISPIDKGYHINIEHDHLLEVMEVYGNRRLDFVRYGNELRMESMSFWIKDVSNRFLKLETPLGTLVLRR